MRYSVIIRYKVKWQHYGPLYQFSIDLRKAYDSGVTYGLIFVICISELLQHMSPLTTLPLEFVIRKVQETEEGLELNGTHQLLTYADHMHIMCRNIAVITNTQSRC